MFLFGGVAMAANEEETRGRIRTASHPPIQTEEKLELIKRYVLLGIVMRILDHDIRVIGTSAIKLPRFYDTMLRGMQDRVLLELAAIKRQFRETGIKVYAANG